MKKDKMIFLDLDGVLVDLFSGIENKFSLKSGSLYKSKYAHDIHLELKMTEEDFWDKLDTVDFWQSLPKFPHSDDLVMACINSPYKTNILTAPSKIALNCASGKLEWIEKHYPFFIKEGRVTITNNKSLLAGPSRVLIDDTSKKIREFVENGGRGILFPQQYNKDQLMLGGLRVARPKNVKEAIKIVKELK